MPKQNALCKDNMTIQAIERLCQHLSEGDRLLVMEYACALVCRQKLSGCGLARILPFRVASKVRRSGATGAEKDVV